VSSAIDAGNGKVAVPDILARKSPLSLSSSLSSTHSNAAKIVCLTAYDFPTARLLDEAGVDVVLVGDSAGMVVLGYENTLPVTLEEMLLLTRAVRRGLKRALLVADMPYGSYHIDIAESVRHAVQFVKEAGAEAVKVEGGERRVELIARLVDAEIPVMGHVGLTPQSLHALGGFRVQGKTAEAAERVLRDAHAVEAAGAFSIVLESMPRELAAHSHDRHRRGPGLRWADPRAARHDRPGIGPHPEVCATLRQRRRCDHSRRPRIRFGRARRAFSIRRGVLSSFLGSARADADRPAHLTRLDQFISRETS
jgi:3-methyl-2-oxobutanoate hydroxymethyltransferase